MQISFSCGNAPAVSFLAGREGFAQNDGKLFPENRFPMKNRKSFSAFLVAALAALCVPASGGEKLPVTDVASGWEVSVEALPPLVVEGTNPPQGVAGAFIRHNGQGKLAVAGGALFPEKGPADGGKKKFYDTIWILEKGADAWKVDKGKLPEPAAYGVACGDYFFGGENETGKVKSRIWEGSIAPWIIPEDALVDPAPESRTEKFPGTIDNAAAFGTAFGKEYVAGGNFNGVPSNKAFRLVCESVPYGENEPRPFPWFTGYRNYTWKPLPDFPGAPRVQPVAALVATPRGGAGALVGGFYFDKATKTATLDRAGVIYYPNENKWETLPPLPESVSEAGLVGSCAVQDGEGGMLIFGGVNAKIFKDALENPAPDYLRREPAWYKFNADVLRLSFDADGNAKWEKLATVPATARAGASAVRGGDGSIYFVCGELKPGFRSPDCCRIKIRRAAGDRR